MALRARARMSSEDEDGTSFGGGGGFGFLGRGIGMAIRTCKLEMVTLARVWVKVACVQGTVWRNVAQA